MRELQDKGARVIGFGGPGDASFEVSCDPASTGLAVSAGAAIAGRTRRPGPQHRHRRAPAPDQSGDPGMSSAVGRSDALGKLVGGSRGLPVPRGITSVCSAHPLVIEAALRRGQAENVAVLIEATCNQVNQEGGYTGMRPADFRRFVEDIAARDRLSCRPPHSGRRSPGAQPVEGPAGRGSAGAGRSHGRRLCRRRLHQDPSRYLDGLRGRAGCAGRRSDGMRAPRGWGALPKAAPSVRAAHDRSSSSAPKSHRPAARPMRSTSLRSPGRKLR